MIKTLAAIALSALAGTAPALAAGPLQISTDFPYPLSSVSDPYTADLATLGVTSGLDSPVTVFPNGPTTLTFKVLESNDDADYQILSLDINGVSHAVPLQTFSGTGTVLATLTTSLPFDQLVGITDTTGPIPPQFIWGVFPVYLDDADTAALTGIGPYIGDVSKLYFSTGNHALFEVDVVPGVPEPGVWTMLLSGLFVAGALLRFAGRKTNLA